MIEKFTNIIVKGKAELKHLVANYKNKTISDLEEEWSSDVSYDKLV